MKSVPGAVATGSQLSQESRLGNCDQVATAPCSDLSPAATSSLVRRVRAREDERRTARRRGRC
jgi:hypothetical protein